MLLKYTNHVIILWGRKYTQIVCKFDIRILFQTSGLLSIGCQDVGGQLSRWNCHDGTWSTQCDHWDDNVLQDEGKCDIALVVKTICGKVAWALDHQVLNERAYLAQSF